MNGITLENTNLKQRALIAREKQKLWRLKMKIKISNIDESVYTVREKLDSEFLNELKASLKEDGQWDPILVRPGNNGKYELISGHNRVQAAKEIGWTEIEANVKDLNDVDATFLSLKTNLVRQDMTAREQGKVLHEITQTFNISGRELAKRIGKSHTWVNDKIKMALDLSDDVVTALNEGKITFGVAQIIASVDMATQLPFLIYILENNITSEDDARKAKRRFLNNTIYSIGYEGKDIKQFIEALQNNGIEQLIDIRFSAESQFKPDFNKAILARELERAKIKYTHRPDFGVPHEWQNPYKAGAIPVDCLEKFYRWKMANEVDFKKTVDDIKNSGKTVIMCMEKYAKPQRDQKIFCHRSILADLILETKEFKERIDL